MFLIFFPCYLLPNEPVLVFRETSLEIQVTLTLSSTSNQVLRLGDNSPLYRTIPGCSLGNPFT